MPRDGLHGGLRRTDDAFLHDWLIGRPRRTLMLFGGDIARPPPDNHTAILEFRRRRCRCRIRPGCRTQSGNVTVAAANHHALGANRSLLFRDPRRQSGEFYFHAG